MPRWDIGIKRSGTPGVRPWDINARVRFRTGKLQASLRGLEQHVVKAADSVLLISCTLYETGWARAFRQTHLSESHVLTKSQADDCPKVTRSTRSEMPVLATLLVACEPT